MDFRTGMFNPTHRTGLINQKSLRSKSFFSFLFWYWSGISVLIFACGDIELKSDSEKKELLLQLLSLPLGFKQHYCTQFSKNRPSLSLQY